MKPEHYDAQPLRITGVQTLVVNAEMRNWVFVKVMTNQDGLVGWGEASLNWKTQAVTGAIRDLEPVVIGEDPRNIERILELMNKRSYYRLGIVGVSAISGIEHALWDIYGKSVGLPVWQLIGGQVRDRVRVYTHLGLGDMRAVYETFDPQSLRDRALAVVDAGYDALKVVFIPYSHYLTRPSERRNVDRLMATLRDAVGPDVDIMIDFHGRPASVAAALQYVNILSKYDPLFCEEPVPPGDTEALKAVTDRSSCPIASGERLVGLEEFIPVLQARALHIAQPDLNHTGGLLVGKRIAALAAAQHIGLAPHNPNGPVAGAAALHFAVSTPNVVIQEEMSGAVPWYDDVVQTTPLHRKGSYWSVPHAPGLGIEINETEAKKHPYKPEVIHSNAAVLNDGTVANW